ncbi:MAG: ATP-binding cassette domain-containing protein, partial [Poseidonia sp.]
MARELINVEAVDRSFGAVDVLRDINLKVNDGDRIGIVGHNGAGKTTLLKTLVGEIEPMGGSIHFDGAECIGEGTEYRVRRGLGYVPQEQAVFGSLTVRENLTLGAMAQADKSGLEMALDFFPKLAARLSQ